MKTETTKKLEKLLNSFLGDNARNNFYVFECTIGGAGKEIVDCINYNCQRQITCYEIKQSVSDFHSKSALTFIGHKNYFVMPKELYEKVKDEIPKDIGCYIPCSNKGHFKFGGSFEFDDGGDRLRCVKPARTRRLLGDKEEILSSMLRCACRDRERNSCFAIKEE